jgi:hypothetical protein
MWPWRKKSEMTLQWKGIPIAHMGLEQVAVAMGQIYEVTTFGVREVESERRRLSEALIKRRWFLLTTGYDNLPRKGE